MDKTHTHTCAHTHTHTHTHTHARALENAQNRVAFQRLTHAACAFGREEVELQTARRGV